MNHALLRFFTSLSFLYALTIGLLLIYGFFYYRDFARSRYQRRRFPYVFFAIGAACIGFLYINMNAPLRLRTFSNLEHHFIRHDGFEVAGRIVLGRSDTVNHPSNAYNQFILEKKGSQISILSPYSDEPFYAGINNSYELLSASYPVSGHTLGFHIDSLKVSLRSEGAGSLSLTINQTVFQVNKPVRKGSNAWNLFRDQETFINSSWYTNDRLTELLKNTWLLRKQVSNDEISTAELRYFIAGRVLKQAYGWQQDGNNLLKNNSFTAPLPEACTIAWGIGFLENNRNQFKIKSQAKDSFLLLNRYPVSYPLSEESNQDWSPHTVNKFLVSDSKDMLNLPPVFNEGFLFAAFTGDSSIDFAPVLLSYRKSAGNDPIELQARFLSSSGASIQSKGNQLLLPSLASHFGWVFSINNTFDWDFGNRSFSASRWGLLLFGSLFFFFLMVFISSWLKPAFRLSWVWQLLSCISLVLLTTRFFLYWRYKSFPPYEGMDLPSQQQLQSFWNFGIIIFATVALALIFGISGINFLYRRIGKMSASLIHQPFNSDLENNKLLQTSTINRWVDRIPFIKRIAPRLLFFASWLVILMGAGAYAAANQFDPATCRHLAIGLVLVYFLFVYISYKHSPLVAAAEGSWWSIHTGRSADIIINNPVKVLLSMSLLALFVFIDIGFAIVFLNFLLFNESFLCINYAIAGLSAGSKRNAKLFGILGAIYLGGFIINLLYAPYIFKFLLALPQTIYVIGYLGFAILIAYNLVRVLISENGRWRALTGLTSTILLFLAAFFFFPKQKILDKASITKYRIDVMTLPADQAIEQAYKDGKTYEPVIRAAQNQWFINTFIYEKNNPGVQSAGFNLLPQAPQNKGAKYNAQATDLVASRFFLAEHGKWSVLLYVLLLLIPTTLLASFYKLYPDFTNRVNVNYPTVTAGFSILNYLLITALLVILAATGRYIFFGQDLPFGSILSKQSVLFPSILIMLVVLLFKNIPLEQYPNRNKFIPGALVFAGLALLLFFVKPHFNRNKEFTVEDLAKNMDNYVSERLQPVLDYFDSSRSSRRWPLAKKDRQFTDSVRKLIAAGFLAEANGFFAKEIEAYTRTGFSGHLDQTRMLYLDLNSGHPQLAVNENYFRIEPPPHLQQTWTGNVYGDSTVFNIGLWDARSGYTARQRLTGFTDQQGINLDENWKLFYRNKSGEHQFEELYLVNRGYSGMRIVADGKSRMVQPGDSIRLNNPCRMIISDSVAHEKLLTIEPDAFMKNYYVNGSRFYIYPMGNRFIWARHFAEGVSSDYSRAGMNNRNAFVSFDYEIMDSLSFRIRKMMAMDTAYKKGAEYGICIADGNGRMIAMTDFIKGLSRPDPNDKPGFMKSIQGENGFISQSLLRKEIGNINLLRMNPGPGSTFKPIVFSAIASQLALDWDQFITTGFTQPQNYYGGEKVSEYDFEKDNGRISRVIDYLKFSDNYYHSNVLLLGSYPKQPLESILGMHFEGSNPDAQMHWPYFSYMGKQYWLNGFENWPGFLNGQANFGTDSSFTSIGLLQNYGIYTSSATKSVDHFETAYDSALFMAAGSKSGFLLPEYGLFDQAGEGVNHKVPYDLFMSTFRGHVKGSSQVMVPPVKMVDAFGKLISQSKNYHLTLNPYATATSYSPFYVDNSISYNTYLSVIRDEVFAGMREALFHGTAARLGTFLKDGAPFYYYAKTGTTGDNEVKTKSKLFAIVISAKDIADPDYNFRNNKFYTIYFTSQNGPAKQNEEFQAAVIKYLQQTMAFNKYMKPVRPGNSVVIENKIAKVESPARQAKKKPRPNNSLPGERKAITRRK